MGSPKSVVPSWALRQCGYIGHTGSLPVARKLSGFFQDSWIRFIQHPESSIQYRSFFLLRRKKNLPRVPLLEFLTRPWGFAEEGEAGFHAGIEKETPHRNIAPHLLPSVLRHHRLHDRFQSDAMQRITRMAARCSLLLNPEI